MANLIGRIQKAAAKREEESLWLMDMMNDPRINEKFKEKIFDTFVRRGIEIKQERKERLRRRQEEKLKFIEEHWGNQ